MRIAIMQPYFIPYPGYFRLFCATDLFVIFDCVQFIRRGWIHRNRLPNSNSQLQWLTLPLQKAPQDILIKDLQFVHDSHEVWQKRMQGFPQLSEKKIDNKVLSTIRHLTSSPLDYITKTLKQICDYLDLPFNIAYSSTLNLPASLKKEERIIEIAKQFGAKEYVNLAGGKSLYDDTIFKHYDLKLTFLSDYQGTYESILAKMMTDQVADLRNDIIKQSK